MKKIIILIIISIGFSSYSQDLTCADFKNGKFLIPGDSLNPESYTITRKNGKQTELDEKGEKVLININYIDDCNYILTYNRNSKNLDYLAKYINSSGGIKVQVMEIKGDTLFYSSLIKNDSINYEMSGKLIKLN